MAAFRSFAIVPAAGLSRRMGVPKLLLPWGRGSVIEKVLDVWQEGDVDRIVVVVRRDDEPLIRICRTRPVDVLTPEPPPDEMKHSVQIALRHVQQCYQPRSGDVFLLAPADMPRLQAETIRRLLLMHRPPTPSILVPMFNGRRGHPVLMPWTLQSETLELAADEGVNALLSRHPVQEIAVPDAACLYDLDRPADYPGPGP